MTTTTPSNGTTGNLNISVDTSGYIGSSMQTIANGGIGATAGQQLTTNNTGITSWTSTVSAIPANTPNFNIGSISGGYSAAGMNGYTISATQPPSTISFYTTNNTEIVRLNKDGTVTWSDEIDVDAAAEAFGRAIQLGGERSAGITAGVKQRMRDTIFEEMIELAKIKGSLTSDDLTYMLQAAKIMDKLKGGYE